MTVAEIDQAIVDIQNNGQSFTLGDMTYTAANIGQLIELRDRLQTEEGRSGGRRPMMRGFNFRNMGYSDDG